MESIASFRQVSKRFGKVPVLEDVTFDVLKSDVVGLIGPNGAGKTTIMRLILGSLHPTSGVVEVLGEVSGAEERPHNREIGFVLDKHGFDMRESARVNVLSHAGLYGIRRDEALSRLVRMVDALDLDIDIEMPLDTYSKGMLQQVSVVRSLIHKPRFLVLDEPTDGLDPSMKKVIQNLIENLSQMYDVSVLVSSHNLKEIDRICNSFVLIGSGRVLFSTREGLPTPNSRYKATFTIGSEIPNARLLLDRLRDTGLAAQSNLIDGKLVLQVDDPKFSYSIHSWLDEQGIEILDVNVRRFDVEDVYFEIIGKERNASEGIGIY